MKKLFFACFQFARSGVYRKIAQPALVLQDVVAGVVKAAELSWKPIAKQFLIFRKAVGD